MFTFDVFREGYCYQMSKNRINFNLSNNDEVISNFKNIRQNKIQHWSKCKVTVGTFNFGNFIKFQRFDNATYALEGFEGNLLKFLATTLNFTISIKNIPELWGSLKLNRNTTFGGAYKMVNYLILR